MATNVGIGTLSLQATTGVDGYTLINGTGDVITYQPPSDGGLHRVTIHATLSVTSGETGGAVIATGTAPDGSALSVTLFAGGASNGASRIQSSMQVKGGTTVAVHQSSALTAGAAVMWAEIWGS